MAKDKEPLLDPAVCNRSGAENDHCQFANLHLGYASLKRWLLGTGWASVLSSALWLSAKVVGEFGLNNVRERTQSPRHPVAQLRYRQLFARWGKTATDGRESTRGCPHYSFESTSHQFQPHDAQPLAFKHVGANSMQACVDPAPVLEQPRRHCERANHSPDLHSVCLPRSCPLL